VYIGYPFSFLDIPEWVKEARHLTFTCLTDASKWPSKRKLDHVVLELSHEFYLSQQICGATRDLRRLSEPSRTRGVFVSVHGDAGDLLTSKIRLDLGWGGEPRREIEGPDGHLFQYRADDELYLKQLEYFVGCVGKGVGFGINSLKQCLGLFEKIAMISEKPIVIERARSDEKPKNIERANTGEKPIDSERAIVHEKPMAVERAITNEKTIC
jgi:hypothetical protein